MPVAMVTPGRPPVLFITDDMPRLVIIGGAGLVLLLMLGALVVLQLRSQLGYDIALPAPAPQS